MQAFEPHSLSSSRDAKYVSPRWKLQYRLNVWNCGHPELECRLLLFILLGVRTTSCLNFLCTEPFSEPVAVIFFFGSVLIQFQDGNDYFGSVRFRFNKNRTVRFGSSLIPCISLLSLSQASSYKYLEITVSTKLANSHTKKLRKENSALGFKQETNDSITRSKYGSK